MQQLVYQSRATQGLGQDEIFRIIETSARNNPARGITGFLAYAGGNFLQLVEGPAEALDTLLSDLAADARHRDLTVLDRRPVGERSFPSWRMERIVIRQGEDDILRRNLAKARLAASIIETAVAPFRPVTAA